MGISATKNKIVVDEQELDIYAAIELQKVMMGLIEKGIDAFSLDLSRVGAISTPAVQVILSAVNSFKKVNINKDSLQPSLIEDLRSIGVEL